MSSGTTLVELPPRQIKEDQEMTIFRNQSSLEIMVQMGFPKSRVEKALAATGDKGVQLASDWLLAHVNDPKLDDYSPRDYILYLCPVGQLQQEFIDFWQKSYQECGWNKAHNYFPHMTLSSFFQADDHMVSQLSHVLKIVAEKVKEAPEVLEFELFSSPVYIGLFANEKSESFLKAITSDFAEEMQKVGVEVEAHKKQLHISLAYHYSVEKYKKLKVLSKDIDLRTPARWDLRIYSRAQIEPNCHVRRVLFSYTSAANDELDLNPGDFLIVREANVQTTEDGWCLGASWMTGCSGMFPLIYTERTAETETWTMHKSIPIVGTDLNVEPNAVEEEHPKTLRSSRYFPNRSLSYATMPASLTHPTCSITQSPSIVLESKSPSLSFSSSSSSVSAAVAVTGAVTNSLTSLATSSSTSVMTTTEVLISSVPTETKVVRPPIAVFTTKNKTKEANKNHSSDIPANCNANISSPESTPSLMTRANDQRQGSCAQKSAPSDPLQSPMSINTFCRAPAIDFSLPVASFKGPRQLYVVKHGESINSTFGKDWIQNSFDCSGKYTRYDLNMPKLMPKRRMGPQEFASDSPLTVQGCFQSKLLGEAMKEKCTKISHVYSSPALKCIQSISNLLQGLGISNIQIKIEPGLSDWLGSNRQPGPSKFMELDELKEAGYPVDDSYNPIFDVANLLSSPEETLEQFYERSYLVTKKILKNHESEGGSVLIMTQGINLESCTRKLVGQSVRSQQSFQDISRKIPYCAMCVAQEATVVLDTWYLIEPPVLPFAHSNNPKYNWTALTTPGLS